MSKANNMTAFLKRNPRAARIGSVIAISTLMTFVGARGWDVLSQPPGPAGMPTGNGWISAGFVCAPISWITWAILAPFLVNRKLWTTIPVGIISPFLGSLILCFGFFLRSLPKDPVSVAVTIFAAASSTFFGWRFIAETARVTLPVGISTAVMIWLAPRVQPLSATL